MFLKCIATVAIVAGATLASAEVSGANPPDPVALERLLFCDGEEVSTRLTPAGFGTPFFVLGATERIIPKHVTVTSGGETFVTIDVPGFDPNRPDAIACAYIDPAGLLVELIGLRVAD